MTTEIHIGTQGWNYDGWVGSFYPPKTTPKETLSLYAKIFDTVEIDSTFYAIPPEPSVLNWFKRTPNHFTFSVKLLSEITHQNRLRDSEALLITFVERMRQLQHKLAVILIQMPPDFSPSEHSALQQFLKLLPPDVNFAIEFRDPKWIGKLFVEELEEYRVSLALTDSKWINRELSFQVVDYLQSPFSYVRWMGPRELTDFSRIQIDRSKEFQQWREAFSRLSAKTEKIFGYFNNHYQGHSPASSNYFKSLLNLPTISPSSLIKQPSLF
jgi:uncharacterized protein YecE (DUF72 family)